MLVANGLDDSHGADPSSFVNTDGSSVTYTVSGNTVTITGGIPNETGNIAGSYMLKINGDVTVTTDVVKNVASQETFNVFSYWWLLLALFVIPCYMMWRYTRHEETD